MKFLHTSDWHLGMNTQGAHIVEDQKFFIEEIASIIKEEGIKVLVIAGDIFDRSLPSVEAVSLYDKAMTRFCEDLGINVLLVAGNHDGAQRLSNLNALLDASGLYIAGVLSRDVKKVSLDDTDFYLLPWFTTERVRALYPEKSDEVKTLADAYALVLGEIREKMDKSRKNVVVSHAYIVNAELSTSDQAAEVGQATAISGSLFADFDYVALGHLHKPQDIGENMRYSGTPMAYSFGKEESHDKSVTIVDTSTGERKLVKLRQLHTRKTIRASYNEIMAADYEEHIKKGYLRIEITDSFIGVQIMTLLKERYDNILEVSGKSLEAEKMLVSLSQTELKELENKPNEIFKRYYQDNIDAEGEIPDGFLKLFEEALEEYEREVSEQ